MKLIQLYKKGINSAPTHMIYYEKIMDDTNTIRTTFVLYTVIIIS